MLRAGRCQWLRSGSRHVYWLTVIGLVCALRSVEIHLAASEASAPKESEIKAAFLYNFTKFIDWPADAFARPDSPFVIAVLGRTPLAAEMEKAVRGRKIGGRHVVVRICRTAADAAASQVVFIAADDVTTRELLQRVQGRAVLTVGETERLLHQGGTIAFLFEDDDKVHFGINMSSADRAGLRVSAQLQKLAKAIIREN